MSKKKLMIIVAAVFILLNVLPLPRGPSFSCAGSSNAGPFVQLFGFPFTYLQRSISPSSCTFTNEAADQQDYFGQHHAYPVKGLIDGLIGLVLVVATGQVFSLKKRNKLKK
ncbi:MAG TPA: hypothetical protein VGG13_01945 [Candidatus Saccharimonadales bacterium]|jgi:hypothetical protein